MEDPPTMQLFFDIYNSSSPPTSSKALEVLVLLASLRRPRLEPVPKASAPKPKHKRTAARILLIPFTPVTPQRPCALAIPRGASRRPKLEPVCPKPKPVIET
eukprot:scaffold27215_cov74-Isochrysis_galbana.AAC.1